MKILRYSPEAARDLENIKRIVTEEFGESVVVKTMKRIGKGIRTLDILRMQAQNNMPNIPLEKHNNPVVNQVIWR